MDSNVRVATYVHGQELWTAEVGQNRSAAGQGGLHLFKQFTVGYCTLGGIASICFIE